MKEKISFEDFCNPEFRKSEQMKVKSEALWLAFLELDGLINISKLARRYFHKSQSWLSQKLHGHSVCDKKRSFTEEEYHQLAESFRDIARRLNQFADAIDTAAMD